VFPAVPVERVRSHTASQRQGPTEALSTFSFWLKTERVRGWRKLGRRQMETETRTCLNFLGLRSCLEKMKGLDEDARALKSQVGFSSLLFGHLPPTSHILDLSSAAVGFRCPGFSPQSQERRRENKRKKAAWQLVNKSVTTQLQ